MFSLGLLFFRVHIVSLCTRQSPYTKYSNGLDYYSNVFAQFVYALFHSLVVTQNVSRTFKINYNDLVLQLLFAKGCTGGYCVFCLLFPRPRLRAVRACNGTPCGYFREVGLMALFLIVFSKDNRITKNLCYCGYLSVAPFFFPTYIPPHYIQFVRDYQTSASVPPHFGNFFFCCNFF